MRELINKEMTVAKHEYPAIRVRQTNTGPALVLFGAPASEIDAWAGVPQKREIEGGETTGFQRDLNRQRLKDLSEFYRDQSNIIQNPLLGATRALSGNAIEFVATGGDGSTEVGILKIEAEDLGSRPLLELLVRARDELTRRVPSLANRRASEAKVTTLKALAVESPILEEFDSEVFGMDGEFEGDELDAIEEEESDGQAAAALSDESHIQDFFEEIDARVQVLSELGSAYTRDSFIGYDKKALISFLQPVLIVDGQHRLRGAVEAARAHVNEHLIAELEALVCSGVPAAIAESQLLREHSRNLPVSLLFSEDPAEHVFQFVIVNQKATPIGTALLGTIVSTSLSNEELERVSARLQNAGIKLEDSRAVAYLTRSSASPFFDRVERGLVSDAKEHLPWTVLGGLIRIFRDLKGGRLFHSKPDFADKWRRKHLDGCAIVDVYELSGFDSPFDYWRSPTGPWRDVFLVFWTCVRDELANVKDSEAKNYWGKARQSQIFNKISLTILAADFFKFLTEKEIELGRPEEVREAVARWLEDVDCDYFARDWDLRGVKKASSGISKQWARLWADYRVDPSRLPKKDWYRKASAE